MDLYFAASFGLVLGVLFGVLLPLSRLREAERVLRAVQLELAIPREIRRLVFRYFHGD